MTTARAHDGSEIYLEAHGTGPTVMLFDAHPYPPEHPAQGQLIAFRDAMLDALSNRYRVVLPAYPDTPKSGLTPEAVTRDLLAIADAARVDRFAFWGHSWGAVIGLQLALATDRVSALALSGFPPLDGPYETMLQSVRALAGVDGAGENLALSSAARQSLPSPSRPGCVATVTTGTLARRPCHDPPRHRLRSATKSAKVTGRPQIASRAHGIPRWGLAQDGGHDLRPFIRTAHRAS